MLDGASVDDNAYLCVRNTLEGNGLRQCRVPTTSSAGVYACDSGWTVCETGAPAEPGCSDQLKTKKCTKKKNKGKCSKKKMKKKCAKTCGVC